MRHTNLFRFAFPGISELRPGRGDQPVRAQPVRPRCPTPQSHPAAPPTHAQPAGLAQIAGITGLPAAASGRTRPGISRITSPTRPAFTGPSPAAGCSTRRKPPPSSGIRAVGAKTSPPPLAFVLQEPRQIRYIRHLEMSRTAAPAHACASHKHSEPRSREKPPPMEPTDPAWPVEPVRQDPDPVDEIPRPVAGCVAHPAAFALPTTWCRRSSAACWFRQMM
jgi:hypothetical protein